MRLPAITPQQQVHDESDRCAQVRALLVVRWQTYRALARLLGMHPKSVRCYVQMVATRELVFCRRATGLRYKPHAYRIFPRAVNVVGRPQRVVTAKYPVEDRAWRQPQG